MPTSSVDTENVLKQIAESMKVELQNGLENEVRITLRPQHLGDVTLKILTDNGIITAQFEAESQRVKEIIESNFNMLKESLEEQGLEVSHLEVNVSSQDNGNQSESSKDTGQNIYGISGDDAISEDELVKETVIQESQVLGSRNSFKA